ncbi:MAG: ketopantoate reductase family protein [Gemmataceae bacterium]
MGKAPVNPPKKHIHIIGAGGIGIALAGRLIRADTSVMLVESNLAKVMFAAKHGVFINNHAPIRIPTIAFDEWNPCSADLILLCVKCYHNESVLARLTGNTPIIPIQNGFDRQLSAHPGVKEEGIASFVSECEPDTTRTRITRKGQLHLGPINPGLPGAESIFLRDTLRESGQLTEIVPWIQPYKYTKLMYNAAISPITSAGGISNSELLKPGPLRQIFFKLLAENYHILHQAGKHLGTIGPFHPATVQRILANPWLGNTLAPFFRPSLMNTYCSMFHDVQKGVTEIANYNGYLVELAKQIGFRAPWNETCVHIIENLSASRQRGSFKHLDKLFELLPK